MAPTKKGSRSSKSATDTKKSRTMSPPRSNDRSDSNKKSQTHRSRRKIYKSCIKRSLIPSSSPMERPLTAHSPAPSPPSFLTLPAELRAQILEYAVTSAYRTNPRYHRDKGLYAHSHTHFLRPRYATAYATTNRSPLAIAFTSRQLYREAAPLYYALNRFHFLAGNWQQPCPPPSQKASDVLAVGDSARDPAACVPRINNSLRDFLKAIGPANTAAVRTLRLTYDVLGVSHPLLLDLGLQLRVLQMYVHWHDHEIPVGLEAFLAVAARKRDLQFRWFSMSRCCGHWADVQREFLDRVRGIEGVSVEK